jgi:hypothetical protein
LSKRANEPISKWFKHEVKKVETKDKFKAMFSRSSDNGDGFILATAPDYIFDGIVSAERVRIVHDPVRIGSFGSTVVVG